MPISPDEAARLASALLWIAGDAEASVLRLLSGTLGRGLSGPRWAEEKAGQIITFRRRVEVIAATYERRARAGLVAAVTEADAAGRRAADAELADVLRELSTFPTTLPGRDAIIALAQEAYGGVAATRAGILRAALDGYRQVVADVSGRVILGAQTRRQVTQEALNRLAARGISGFTDRAGRRWDLASYLEMATRTAAQRAMVQGHSDALQARGINLVIVSDAPQECVRCRPWEGKVLATDGGRAGVVSLPSVTSNRTVRVSVDGTLRQAVSAGLFHPGCRHSLSAYLPGATRRPEGPTADPQGDRARQRLRALERQVRAAKRKELVALSPADAARARAEVRAAQARIREHVAQTGIIRVPAREQLVRPQP